MAFRVSSPGPSTPAYSRDHLSAPTRAAPSYFPQSPSQTSFGQTLSTGNGEYSVRSRAQSQVSVKSVQTHRAPSRTTSITVPCDVCNRADVKTWTCIQCNNDSFCDACWNKERAHRPGAVGFDGKPHERTDRRVVERLREILEPKRTPEEQQELHKNDEDTTWFGISRDSANLPIFQDYQRFATIMAESRTSEVNVRYPQLVSFIGQTGAGKSTLIKMLIDHQENSNLNPFSRSHFPSPVTGSINDNIPTSGDVHLYSDPTTYLSDTPMLYADCEGLNGGENVPRGARYKRRDDAPPPAARSLSANNDATFRKKIRKVAHSAQRDIAWATTPETRKREYAVTQLYPRLLYTFSDVVVFVLRNAKVFESVVLEKLLEWASASIEWSLNQPALPHVIIALNATEINIDEKQWGVEKATELLMSDIAGAISRVPRFKEYAIFWEQRGRHIRTTKDLLECYYSSVTVVRIPTHGRYMLINDQISKLHAEIRRCCKSAFLTKKRVRMISTDDQLEGYLQSAFDNFSQNLNVPFDFVKESVKNNPIPRDFGGNILKLAIAVRDHNCFSNRYDGPRIFEELSRMVASCLMLNSARQSLLGSNVELLENVYMDMCDEALETFCNNYWSCSFSNRNGQCNNKKSGHNPKGHQNSEGKIIGVGAYQSTFHVDDYADEWINKIRESLEKIQHIVHETTFNSQITEQQAASNVHRAVMNDFYQAVGEASKFVSHSACFSCLRELPEHPLPCGHVLCIFCVKAYGRQTSKTIIELESCPLHVTETKSDWDNPWRIRVKPLHAGIRVLSLDGGGMRGIVELETLKAIERALGGELPIQLFFDLIVGTSTGGIIALGLGVENWSVDACINKFTELCGQAFVPRELIGVPLLGKLSMANHRSMYKTRPFERALRDVFEDRPLFGRLNNPEGHMIKVAITSTTFMDQKPIVIANYNRPDFEEYGNYSFQRQDNPALELKIWEAARATSAAPPYFKTFIKNETKSGYIDGALYHNNPVKVAHHERTLIWRDVSSQQPDVFLSIGTGHNGHKKQQLSDNSSFLPNWLNKPLPPRPDLSPPPQLKKFATFTGQLWSTVSDRFDNILNCENRWDEFRVDVLGKYDSDRARYIRLNPDLRFKVPKLDDVAQLHTVGVAASHELKNNPRIREVAHRLIASSFFFERVEASTKEKDGKFECKGFICCRFDNGSEEMKALGRYILKHFRNDFEPYFIVQEDRNYEDSQKIPITEFLIQEMSLRGRFNVDRIHITVEKQMSATTISLCLQEEHYPACDTHLPISGFPRTLMTESIPQKSTTRGHFSRNSGSFNRKPRRRRRAQNKDSGDDSPPQPSSLRRIKSSSNLRNEEAPRTAYPNAPTDVNQWARRRNSVDNLMQRGIFELHDTSPMPPPSEMPIDTSLPSFTRNRSLFHNNVSFL